MKTRDQYRYERDALQKEVTRLNKEIDKLEREVLDYKTAMRRMQRHNELVLQQRRDTSPDQPQWDRQAGWFEAMDTFSREVVNAAAQD